MYVQARMGEKKRTYDLFISYSRQDEGFVSQLTKRLDAWGYTYWIDVNGIESGDVFKKNIVKAIKASEVVVFVSSKASNESPWTIKEVNYALHNKKPIIPIRIDETEYNEVLLFDLDVLDYVNCTRASKWEEGFERVSRALQHYFPDHKLPTPAAKSEPVVAGIDTKSAQHTKRLSVKALLLGLTYVICMGLISWVVWEALHKRSDSDIVELQSEDEILYTLDDEQMTGMVAGVPKTQREITIPEEIVQDGKTYTITRIGASAFTNNTNLSRVTLPNSITYVGEFAFSGCGSLCMIDLHEGIETIDSSAFLGCANLRKMILPSTLKEIGANAFSGCAGLTELEIPNGLKRIGDKAFMNCSGLTELRIPDNVELGFEAFSSCMGLKNIVFGDKVKMGDFVFMGCGGLERVEIPGCVEEIGHSAFYICDNLQQVVIGEGVKKIGPYAFARDMKLTSVEIPNSVEEIGERAFSRCILLKSVKIPKNVVLGENVFQDGCKVVRK